MWSLTKWICNVSGQTFHIGFVSSNLRSVHTEQKLFGLSYSFFHIEWDFECIVQQKLCSSDAPELKVTEQTILSWILLLVSYNLQLVLANLQQYQGLQSSSLMHSALRSLPLPFPTRYIQTHHGVLLMYEMAVF